MPLHYRLLRVDLDHQRMETQVFDEQLVRKFIGGSGIASKIIWDETGSTTEPLSPENPLVFMIGPYTGTSVPANSRLTVASCNSYDPQLVFFPVI